MYLNDFLNFKLGVDLDDKYNFLVVKEILDNGDKYPLIHDMVENEVSYDEYDNVINEPYDSSFFECDDPSCAGVNESIELYNAFLVVMLKDIKENDYRVKSVSCGVDYLRYPSISCIINPYLNYSGMDYIILFNQKTEVNSEIFVPNIVGKECYGHRSIESNSKQYFDDNGEVLDKIKEALTSMPSDSLIINDFKDEDLKNCRVELENNIYGYRFDSYDIRIGNNLIKLYSTDREKDNYSFIREMILKSLRDDEINLDVVKRIENKK